MPQSNLNDYLKELKSMVKGNSAIFDDDPYDGCLKQAVQEYSQDKPRHIVQEYTSGSDSAFVGEDRTFPLPTYWDDEISVRSFRIENPVDTTSLQDRLFDVEQCMLYQKPTVTVLRLRSEEWMDIPIKVGDKFYLRYWGLHQLDGTGVTVPDSRFYALCNLAASKLCQRAASRTAGLGSANIANGQAAYATQSGQWKSMSDFFYKEYKRMMNPDEGDAKPSAVFINPTTSELHDYPHGLWPRDSDGRKNLLN